MNRGDQRSDQAAFEAGAPKGSRKHPGSLTLSRVGAARAADSGQGMRNKARDREIEREKERERQRERERGLVTLKGIIEIVRRGA